MIFYIMNTWLLSSDFFNKPDLWISETWLKKLVLFSDKIEIMREGAIQGLRGLDNIFLAYTYMAFNFVHKHLNA